MSVHHPWADSGYHRIGYALHPLAYMANGGFSNRWRIAPGGLLRLGIQKDIHRQDKVSREYEQTEAHPIE